MTRSDGPAHLRQVRRGNLRTVLLSLADGPGSRADLAQRTGLTKATIANLVDPLVRQRILCEDAALSSGRGRPSRPVRFHPDAPVAIGAEVNVGHLATAVRGLDGAIRSHRRVNVDNRHRSPARIVEHLARLIRAAVDECGQPVLGVGLAVPGIVRDGVVVRAPNVPGLVDTPVGERLSTDLEGLHVLVDNEANLAAFGELWPHRLIGDDYVYVSGDIGIGTGMVIDGRLYRGVAGFAGELGHVAIERGGRECSCGGRGCVEQYAGLDAILGSSRCPGIGELLRAIERGDERARATVEDAGAALGVAVATLLNIVDITTVVLGGAYAVLFDQLAPAIRSELDTRVLAASQRAITLAAAPHGDRAVVFGAAGMVAHRACLEPELLTAALPSVGVLHQHR
ncbi:ROK family protein [Nocardia otitidiscaviarum]|uniref:ROK family protein n=1 Tax=Nocardia otitidiscaviarum TaxID=1823 RepID=UPI0018931782|nr:ROK family protein [Nocardia otitidiscaviarum]MBF6180818.1 ROK family protein [Nocardia otitidiscaviarum]